MSIVRTGSAVIAVFVAAYATTSAAETLRQLDGGQIRSKLAGMELSDGVHSRDMFGRDGVLTSHAMGKKTAGTWRVRGDELCLTRPKEDESCYVVWAAGTKVELRRKGTDLPLIEGVLGRPR
jgi:hypothetical protein